ncbi:MAG: endo-1,4-beta-xylanase [Planctomycetota bacterium]
MINLSFGLVLAGLTAVWVLLSALPACAEESKPWSDEPIQARIQKHRTAEVTLAVQDAAGRPLAAQPVTVCQVRHKFLFGSNAFVIAPQDQSETQKKYQERFAALLNYATLPFYWGGYEGTEGQPQAERLRSMAEWCAQNHVRAKGHPLCWHEVVPKWLPQKTLEEVQALQVARISREVQAFAGLIDNWDVANEFCVTPNHQPDTNPIAKLCRKLGQVELLKLAFNAAHAANPKAVLLLNDFDTSEKYAALLKSCLDAGLPIDAIGIQSHMHGGYWGAQKAWETCERFAKFGKPLFFTETTIISGDKKQNMNWQGAYKDWDSNAAGEQRQKEQVTEFYRILFSHPAVQGLTWWDFSDLHAWLGAPSGLVRKDMSPKPAYEALMQMIKKDWWTGPLQLTSDTEGRVKFKGFQGRYRAESAGANGEFEVLDAGQATAAVKLEAAK